MPAPATTDELFAVVEKSRLVSAPVLGGYRSGATEFRTPERATERMVRDGVLTPFQASMLLAGKTRPFFVGPYKVLSRIGNGSMGVVYLCEHVNMRRKVAVKVLQGRRTKDEVAVQRFLREARAAGALAHPNVVRALDLGCEGEIFYLSMEYIDGANLTELVRAEGPLPPVRLVEYLRQAAAGLQHAHESGLIHRDIRPNNVMIGRDGVVKLLDLGLALFADGVENLTQGAPVGSLGYIAPEQAQDGHTVDARADIFSLGATLYFAMTGHAPNPARGVSGAPAPNGHDGSDFARLLAIVQRMMAPAAGDRFQTAAEVVAVATQWLQPPTAPDSPGAKKAGAEAPAESTDFELHAAGAGIETDTDDFALNLFQDPPPVTRAPDLAPESAPPAAPARPSTKPRGQSEAPPKPTWMFRYRWPVALILAALIGFAASSVIRSKRPTADTRPQAPAGRQP